MVKKIFLVLMIVMMVASVGFASPLTDYSQGKVALDISIRPSGNLSYLNEFGETSSNEKHNNFGYGVTIGLGNKFAFQYRNNKVDSVVNTDEIYTVKIISKDALTAQEYNVLYKLDKGLSAFVGVTNIKSAREYNCNQTSWFDSPSGMSPAIPAGPITMQKSKIGYQVGLIGSTKIGDKTTAYGIVGVGDYITNYEIGVGYELAKNVDLNIGYRDTKYKHQQNSYGGVDSYEFDCKFSGMSYGITYKF